MRRRHYRRRTRINVHGGERTLSKSPERIFCHCLSYERHQTYKSMPLLNFHRPSAMARFRGETTSA